ncbi:cation:proton antiporter [[Clostridium] symbiosum]|uniref:cation:proton antiporter n=1 Tax=Clostridium symbiosum TaxID=1512 RepID=UPI001D08E408|nr:cation:proton antiporter [[Clostridium] symbiosum]MCB6611119.1 cation:proton antiporter [[Clostridium] symbiosum]MCB6930239.1 cation:proton antiporter [[Clostridium] symbiosum]
MSSVEVFRDLAVILVAAKFCGIAARKLHAPQVAGVIVAGLLIGPGVLGIVKQSEFLGMMAEIGVVLLMFSAGLETNLRDLVKTGPVAFLIACAGVAVPLVGGTLLYMIFYGVSPLGSEEFYRAVFIGVIMTATSVSITVESLRELGKLKGKTGTAIMGAAIIDDVIGIIVLTFVIGFRDPQSSPVAVIINTVLFFLFAGVSGFVFYKVFKWLDARYPHTRRIPILGLAFCLFLSYVAETYFGIADITGAYAAGIVLCSLNDSDYIASKMDINSYMLFGPVFFASIGLKTNVGNITPEIMIFSAAFVAVALVTKIMGCGMMARICGFSGDDSLKIGVGMMTRGEVALIVAQKGLAVGLLNSVYFTSVIFLIIISSIVTPIILKVLYTNKSAARGILRLRRAA